MLWAIWLNKELNFIAMKSMHSRGYGIHMLVNKIQVNLLHLPCFKSILFLYSTQAPPTHIGHFNLY